MSKYRPSAVIAAELETLRTELLSLVDKPAEDTTDEDVTRSETATAEFRTLRTEYEGALAHETEIEAVRSLALNPARTEPPQGPRSPEVLRKVDPWDADARRAVAEGHAPARDMISRARAAVDQAPRVPDSDKDRLENILEMTGSRQTAGIARHILLTGSPDYHTEFEEFFRSRGMILGEAMRAAMTLTDANGGYLVPFTLDPTIILTNAGIVGNIRTVATTKTIVTDNWNGVTSAGVSAEWTGEATAWADASPTFAQPTITPKKADAWIQGSYEVLADAGFASELGMLLADAKVRHEEAAFATANTGATKPRGVIAAVAAVTASIVTSATTNAFVIADIYAVANGLRARDAAAASWLANKKIFNLARQFDTTGSAAYWANLGMATPNQLLGQPNYECSTMASAVTTGGNILLAGDMSKYYIVDRVGMSVLYEPMVKTTASGGRPTGEAGWAAFWRVGADVVDVDAFRLLQLNQVAANVALA